MKQRKKIVEQETIIKSDDKCLLVQARPGRGKTSVALWFAEDIISNEKIATHQKILFLTFSRSAVYQISQKSKSLFSDSVRNKMMIATYHSFMWWLIHIFGRYRGLPKNLELIWDTKAYAYIHDLKKPISELSEFLAKTAQGITYDNFIPIVLNILQSKNIIHTLNNLFPIIIVDEFQDTNAEQWELIKIISAKVRLFCLADPDQMIHRFRGASEHRLQQLIEEKGAKCYSLQNECLRTEEHDLLDFAEAILDNKKIPAPAKQCWNDRFMINYMGPKARAYYLKHTIIELIKNHKKRNVGDNPSIAIAVYANKNVNLVKQELAKKSGKISTQLFCRTIESGGDETIEDLIIHLLFWFCAGSQKDLEIAVKILGVILAKKNFLKMTEPIKAMFSPEKLLAGEIKAKGTAKKIKDCLYADRGIKLSLEEGITRVQNSLTLLRGEVKTLGEQIKNEKLNLLINTIKEMGKALPKDEMEKELRYLKQKITNARLKRCILERTSPFHGIVATTIHKLKGKEFDYIVLLTNGTENFYNQDKETEKDARRLLYVALTRARYDAKILYVGTRMPPLLQNYIL